MGSPPPPGTSAGLTVRQLFAEYASYVWRLLRRLGVREADVDDVCQEVFVVVHRKLPSFEGRSSARTWLYGISVRVAKDHQRRAHVRRERLDVPVPEQTTEERPDDAMAQAQRLQQLDAALEHLNSDQRAVTVLYEIEGLAMPEVAVAVGCPLQTAYSRLRAAHRVLRTQLNRHENEEVA